MNTENMLATADFVGMQLWTEQKREQFITTFRQRAACSHFILVQTACDLYKRAVERKFISAKHESAILRGMEYNTNLLRYRMVGSAEKASLGGRDPSELVQIASERAADILKSLPPLAQAVRVIDAETAGKIDRKASLLEKGQVLRTELEETTETVKLSDMDQSMTIAAFVKHVKDRDKRRRKLIDELNEIATEGRALEEHIDKALYSGLPGLSDAVVEVIRSQLEQAAILQTTVRRVEEQVRFGDCEKALELLRTFEKDEVKVSDEIRSKFETAMQTLKSAIRGKKKQKATKRLAK